jgi:hypothetical protein
MLAWNDVEVTAVGSTGVIVSGVAGAVADDQLQPF